MTQQLGCSILIDEATAQGLPDNSPWVPIPFGQIQPYAMDRSVGVFRIEGHYDQQLSPDHVSQITEAVKAFQSGQWDLAVQHLEHVSAEDPTKRLLLATIAELGTPPKDFAGLISMKRK